MRLDLSVVKIDEPEITELSKADDFNRLHPDKCNACGSTGPFTRHVFLVRGVSKSRQGNEFVQNSVRRTLYDRHGASHVVFKTHKKGFYADSAICGNCGSPDVVWDIELTDDIIAKAAALTGQSAAELKLGLERVEKLIRKQDQVRRTRRP